MREINRLDYNLGLLNSFYRKTYKKIVKKDAPYYYINGNRVISYPREVNQMFSRMICEDAPFMAARFGSVELSAINELYKGKLDKDYRYSKKVMHTLCFNAGFFPEEEKYIEQFGQLMVSDCKYLDVIGLWNDMLEIFTIKTFASNAQGVKLYCFEPYYDIESSWTHALAGKKVLIVHPFANTISNQFKNKDKLFDDGFWPECKLITYKAIQTIAGEKDTRFQNWFEALKYMITDIQKLNFDIAIIGCGAYGFPLAAAVKRMGKQAIHLGGATQLLFGIRGNRWENSELRRFFNEYWVKPGIDEIPSHAGKIENGCYW